LAIAVVNEVKTSISLTNMKLKHEDELHKSINVKLKYLLFASDTFVLTSLTTAIAKF
jgi:hypothetical protein